MLLRVHLLLLVLPSSRLTMLSAALVGVSHSATAASSSVVRQGRPHAHGDGHGLILLLLLLAAIQRVRRRVGLLLVLLLGAAAIVAAAASTPRTHAHHHPPAWPNATATPAVRVAPSTVEYAATASVAVHLRGVWGEVVKEREEGNEGGAD